ncbi:MAG: hypothetical protein JWM71_935 [Solirubrobacteraceae bacterium]|nr:hypothetical protein [Solirubrobacteraceae bacterium]
MFGMRCEGCGEVRWSILGRATGAASCPACGAKMIEERRRPGSLASVTADPDRRDAVTFEPAGDGPLSVV